MGRIISAAAQRRRGHKDCAAVAGKMRLRETGLTAIVSSRLMTCRAGTDMSGPGADMSGPGADVSGPGYGSRLDVAGIGPGADLQAMADRIDALGGQIRIDPAPGRGTRISGSVPATAIG